MPSKAKKLFFSKICSNVFLKHYNLNTENDRIPNKSYELL